MNRQKTRTDLINDGFNRYSLNAKDGLPSWFLDDESKHYKSNLPITKEAVAALRAKMRALDARPIKKVAEAKARKKFKEAQRLEKAMKKAEGVNETSYVIGARCRRVYARSGCMCSVVLRVCCRSEVCELVRPRAAR